MRAVCKCWAFLLLLRWVLFCQVYWATTNKSWGIEKKINNDVLLNMYHNLFIFYFPVTQIKWMKHLNQRTKPVQRMRRNKTPLAWYSCCALDRISILFSQFMVWMSRATSTTTTIQNKQKNKNCAYRTRLTVQAPEICSVRENMVEGMRLKCQVSAWGVTGEGITFVYGTRRAMGSHVNWQSNELCPLGCGFFFFLVRAHPSVVWSVRAGGSTWN